MDDDAGEARRNAGEPVRTLIRPTDRRPRPKRWADAVDQLRQLQAEYEAWREQLPASLANSRTAELLAGVCDVDLDAPRRRAAAGFRPRLMTETRKPPAPDEETGGVAAKAYTCGVDTLAGGLDPQRI